ncbi:uncharacterized protein DUF1624 [Sphaerotilus hippei]|uniref:Uncharacterized protein DUF1624 n=2 Tax=Sphaerotilus hippei TaxID=744406 RepID=A0A318H350_9BURK|nr:uncharacterized protein DUF1624 [Sphaerotilus hippei]
MLWMTAFHLAFDLNHFGLMPPQRFLDDAFWTGQRVAILSIFLFCAGAGQAVAQAQSVSWPRFWRRWRLLLGAAVLVSAGSALMFPQRWISSGVLHGLLLMVLGARLLAPACRGRRGDLLLPLLALTAFVLPLLWSSPWFDSRWTWWIGLGTHKPPTEDHVPLLPWSGVLLLGLWAGRLVLRRRTEGEMAAGSPGPVTRPVRALAWLGRHSLGYYLLHQPVLIAALTAWTALA